MMQLSPRSYKEHSIEGDAAGKTTHAVAKSSFCHEVAVALKRYSSLAFPVLFTLCVTHTPPPLSLFVSDTHTQTQTHSTSPPFTLMHIHAHTHTLILLPPLLIVCTDLERELLTATNSQSAPQHSWTPVMGQQSVGAGFLGAPKQPLLLAQHSNPSLK